MGIQVQPCCCRKWYALTTGGYLLTIDPDVPEVIEVLRYADLAAGNPDSYDAGYALRWSHRDSSLYALVFDSAADYPDLRKLNQDGTTELVGNGNVANPAQWGTDSAAWGLAAHPDAGTLHGLALLKLVAGGTFHAFTIQPGSGFLAPLPQPLLPIASGRAGPITGLDWVEGTLYGHEFSFAGNWLYTIDANSGQATEVVDFATVANPPDGGGVAHHEGRLYFLWGTGPFGFGYWDVAAARWTRLGNVPAAAGVGGIVRGLTVA